MASWMRKKGFTVWFTGLSASGKTTLAVLLAEALERRGIKVELLDGDVTRCTLCKGLGFSKEDRDENIRRIGYVCRLLSKHGVAAIAAVISPYRAVREEVRVSMENFVEVFTKAPLEVCMQRDPKGLYKRAIAGEIQNFTGVSDPYEEPEASEVVVQTDRDTPEDCTAQILAKLEELGLVPRLRTREASRGRRVSMDVAKSA